MKRLHFTDSFSSSSFLLFRSNTSSDEVEGKKATDHQAPRSRGNERPRQPHHPQPAKARDTLTERPAVVTEKPKQEATTEQSSQSSKVGAEPVAETLTESPTERSEGKESGDVAKSSRSYAEILRMKAALKEQAPKTYANAEGSPAVSPNAQKGERSQPSSARAPPAPKGASSSSSQGGGRLRSNPSQPGRPRPPPSAGSSPNSRHRTRSHNADEVSSFGPSFFIYFIG